MLHVSFAMTMLEAVQAMDEPDNLDEQRRKAGEVWATYYLLEAALPLVRCALLHTVPTIAEQHLWWGAVSEHEVSTEWVKSGVRDGTEPGDELDELTWQIGRLCEQADEDILRLDGLISEAESTGNES